MAPCQTRLIASPVVWSPWYVNLSDKAQSNKCGMVAIKDSVMLTYSNRRSMVAIKDSDSLPFFHSK